MNFSSCVSETITQKTSEFKTISIIYHVTSLKSTNLYSFLIRANGSHSLNLKRLENKISLCWLKIYISFINAEILLCIHFIQFKGNTELGRFFPVFVDIGIIYISAPLYFLSLQSNLNEELQIVFIKLYFAFSNLRRTFRILNIQINLF